MKKKIELQFMYGSASFKPCCRARDHDSGETVAFCTRDNWAEAEKAAIRDAEKHYTYGPIPRAKTVEIEIEDSWPDNVIKPGLLDHIADSIELKTDNVIELGEEVVVKEG